MRHTLIGVGLVMLLGIAIGGCSSQTSSTHGSGSGGTSATGISSSGSSGSFASGSTSATGMFVTGSTSTGVGGNSCPIATIGVPGKYGQGDLFAAWLSSQGESPSGNLLDQVLTPALLGPYKILVAQDVSHNHAYSASEVTALDAWIHAGGGFMTMIGYQGPQPPEATNVNRLLAPSGISYGSQPILSGSAITNWVHPHPVTQGISNIGFDNGYAVQGPGTMLANQSGYQVLEVLDVGSGHILAWGDEWISYDSFWSTNPQVPVFWQNIVDWFDPTGGCQVPIPM
jgi:hypothetical protein